MVLLLYICENIIGLIEELNFLLCRNSADDGNSNTLRKAGSKIATNGSLNMSKKHQSPVRQASVLHAQSWQEEPALNEEVVDDIDSEDNEHYATLNEQHHYSTLRKGHPAGSGSSRYQRNSRSAQMSHFSQFSRLPPGTKKLQQLCFDIDQLFQFQKDQVLRTESYLQFQT